MFSLVTTMVTEFSPHRGASLVGLNSLGRNVFAAVGGAVTQPLSTAVGVGWLYTGLGILSLGNAAVVFAVHRHGHRWREDISSDGKLSETSREPDIPLANPTANYPH